MDTFLRRLRPVVVGVVVLGAATALAVDPPPPGDYAILGIYTTLEFNDQTENFVMVPAGETVTIHFLLSYAPWAFLGGAEFAVETDPPGAFGTHLMLGDTTLPADGLLITEPPVFVIGYGSPNYSSSSHHWVMSQEVTALTDSPVFLKLQPVPYPTLPGEMAYAYWINPAEVHVMKPNSEGYSHDAPVFGVNTLIVATESPSWSHVKALFR